MCRPYQYRLLPGSWDARHVFDSVATNYLVARSWHCNRGRCNDTAWIPYGYGCVSPHGRLSKMFCHIRDTNMDNASFHQSSASRLSPCGHLHLTKLSLSCFRVLFLRTMGRHRSDCCQHFPLRCRLTRLFRGIRLECELWRDACSLEPPCHSPCWLPCLRIHPLRPVSQRLSRA